MAKKSTLVLLMLSGFASASERVAELLGLALTSKLSYKPAGNRTIEKPSLLSAVKDSGAIDVTLEEDEQGDG